MNIWSLTSILLVLLLAASFYVFEKKHAVVEKTVLIAILTAVSSVGRALFVAIPSVQPSSFIIIMAGLALGAETGFMTGALTAVISGLMLGIGPWTPWQMLAWSLMGGLAGILRKPLTNSKTTRIGYGTAWGFLFGWIMNLWMIISVNSGESGWPYFISIYAASFVFDLLHAVFNALLLAFGGDMFLKALTRIGIKYGLINDLDNNYRYRCLCAKVLKNLWN